jgi:hypothetical protein
VETEKICGLGLFWRYESQKVIDFSLMVRNICPKHVGFVHNIYKRAAQIVGAIICADYSPPPPFSCFYSKFNIRPANMYVPRTVNKTDNM